MAATLASKILVTLIDLPPLDDIVVVGQRLRLDTFTSVCCATSRSHIDSKRSSRQSK
jgi:hypothetical protein